MQGNFQKNVFKIMFMILVMQMSIVFVSWFAEKEIKLQKELIYSTIFGDNFVDCLENIHEKEKYLPAEEIENNSVLQKAQNSINLINIFSIIVAVGIIYLFSCRILRFAVNSNNEEKR